MQNKKGKTREIDDFIDDAEAVSATEMTGLVPTMPENNAQKENYADVMKFKAKRKKK